MDPIQTTESATCVIGDIHGCHTALGNLLQQVVHRADTLVFLGDYVDRGPNSQAVVATLLALKKRHPRVITLMGNHDWLFLQFLTGQDSSLFLQVGGLQTLASYGLGPDADQQAILRCIPPEHITFFKNLPLLWENQHAIYVHAGLQPGRHLSLQSPQWCLWAKDSFHRYPHDFGKPVVFGHTVYTSPQLSPERIGIDTGAVYGGRLTALLLPERELISVSGEAAVF